MGCFGFLNYLSLSISVHLYRSVPSSFSLSLFSFRRLFPSISLHLSLCVRKCVCVNACAYICACVFVGRIVFLQRLQYCTRAENTGKQILLESLRPAGAVTAA